jgi:peptidoglycan/LPS O-acetylase OafA/YrhL
MHFWSLSLEEQFYLVWPLLLLLTGIRRCPWIAATAAVACTLYRWIFWAHYSHSLTSIQSQVRADAILVGCLLSFLLANPRFRSVASRWSPLLALPACTLITLSVDSFHAMVPLRESICIAALLAYTMLNPQSLIGRALSFPALTYIGTISYSAYIWQEFFMGQFGGGLRAMLLLCFAMPLFALGSYYFIERPCTRFAHRLTHQTSRTPAEAHQLPA